MGARRSSPERAVAKAVDPCGQEGDRSCFVTAPLPKPRFGFCALTSAGSDRRRPARRQKSRREAARAGTAAAVRGSGPLRLFWQILATRAIRVGFPSRARGGRRAAPRRARRKFAMKPNRNAAHGPFPRKLQELGGRCFKIGRPAEISPRASIGAPGAVNRAAQLKR